MWRGVSAFMELSAGCQHSQLRTRRRLVSVVDDETARWWCALLGSCGLGTSTYQASVITMANRRA
ncbi:hypothetical protein TcasGA2_TC034151 [Tribolium castaneum]|uniref:Uncharacterized protein n=1 Tax=Tribolium castaneum TaxID=7070 RepID=A0A139WD47_TRICA|nr:hypothetical protein TcasGA2_TC034151 [Tribolium castaneum]